MWLVNWADLLANDCPVAEEVTVPGGELVSGAKASTKRPTVSVSEGTRQNLDNRTKKFIQPFFSTSVTLQGHPTGDPTDRLERQALGSLQRRLRGCLVGVRAEPFAYDSDEFTALEVFLMQLAAGMEIDTPAVRPYTTGAASLHAPLLFGPGARSGVGAATGRGRGTGGSDQRGAVRGSGIEKLADQVDRCVPAEVGVVALEPLVGRGVAAAVQLEQVVPGCLERSGRGQFV
jgi:hypothetical protein